MLTCARYAQLRRCAADAYRRCMRATILQELVRTNARRACARGHDPRMHKKHTGMHMETHTHAHTQARAACAITYSYTDMHDAQPPHDRPHTQTQTHTHTQTHKACPSTRTNMRTRCAVLTNERRACIRAALLPQGGTASRRDNDTLIRGYADTLIC
jgi:hypothetical protein